MSANPRNSKPLLFISHKHVDSKIADAIRTFVSMSSGGRVEVFQSSSALADSPKAGRNLNKQLRATLTRASVVILVYTSPDKDWTYCMWECGVASHPQDPESLDTKIILFQCTGSAPALFSDQVNINTRNLVDIQKFTDDFLTSSDFFPGLGRAVTDFQSHGPEVASAAADFCQKLQLVLPPEKEDPAIEWPAFPYLQFELDFKDVDLIKKSGPKNRAEAYSVIQEKCIISSADKYGEQLFGVPSFPNDMSFKQLADLWRETYPTTQSKWVEALSGQIMDGAMWRFSKPVWKLMQGLNDDCWYAPIMNRVRKIPIQQLMQFDVYFYKFDVDSQKQAVEIDLPADSDTQE